jgi:hypothetical protein
MKNLSYNIQNLIDRETASLPWINYQNQAK